MSNHFDVVLSRLGNMLKRISAKDTEFVDLCQQHADITSQIRKLAPEVDPAHAQQDENLRRRRAAMEDEMLAIMQANTRI